VAVKAQVGTVPLAEANRSAAGELHLIHSIQSILWLGIMTCAAHEPVSKWLGKGNPLLQVKWQARGRVALTAAR